MCNEYERKIDWDDFARTMERIELGLATEQGLADVPPAPSIRISDIGTVLRAAGNGVELAPMRFAFPPPRKGASPVFTFRSEGRSFEKSNRCLILASAFFEFTGTRSPKAKHRFTPTDAPLLAIAGIWRDFGGNQAFTMLTTEPGPDIAPFHNRQVVVLPPQDWSAWIYLSRPENELLRPLAAGSIREELMREGRF